MIRKLAKPDQPGKPEAPMEAALAEAQAAARRGEVPVGAVLADAAGAIIARAGPLVRQRDQEPTIEQRLIPRTRSGSPS